MRNPLLLIFAATTGLLATAASKPPLCPPDFSLQVESQKDKKAPTTRYAVVKVGTSYQVKPATAVKELRKQLDAEYKQALKAWQEAKKAAAKNKEKFSDPRPRKQRAKVLSDSFKSAADAQEYIAKLQEKEKAKRRGKSKPTKSGKKKGKG